jgi:hypothetical protein
LFELRDLTFVDFSLSLEPDEYEDREVEVDLFVLLTEFGISLGAEVLILDLV